MAKHATGLMVPVGTYGDLPALKVLADLAEELALQAFFLEERPGSELDPVVALGHLGEMHPLLVLGMLLRAKNGRPPSVLAKLVSGLDLATEGRVTLALGDLDEASPPDDHLLEALALIREMLTCDVTTFSGHYFEVEEAWNRPRMTRDLVPWPKVSLALSLTGLVSNQERLRPRFGAFFVGIGGTREVPVSLHDLESMKVQGTSRELTVVVVDADLNEGLAIGDEVENHFDAVVYRWRELPDPEVVRAWFEARSARP